MNSYTLYNTSLSISVTELDFSGDINIRNFQASLERLWAAIIWLFLFLSSRRVYVFENSKEKNHSVRNQSSTIFCLSMELATHSSREKPSFSNKAFGEYNLTVHRQCTRI